MLNKKLLPISIVIAGVIIGGVLLFTNQGCEPKKTEGLLTAQEASQKAIDFINENLIEGDVSATLGEVNEQNGLYKFHLTLGEQEFDSYVTRDGKYLFPDQPIDLDQKLQTGEESSQSAEVPKTEVPDVKLFVMSYCPYGLQAEKGFLPVYNLLSGRANMGIYFVDYIMHEKQEIDENLRQYCIQEGQREKFADYLGCFVGAGEVEKCLSEAKVDQVQLNSCIEETDREYKITEKYNDKSTWVSGSFPEFDVHTDLNQKYGVSGSPTFVINDKVVQISRSPEAIKTAVCNAFSSAPAECSQTLSTETPSPGFGGGTSGSSGGSCQ